MMTPEQALALVEIKSFYKQRLLAMAEIQRDAREGTVPVEDVRPLVAVVHEVVQTDNAANAELNKLRIEADMTLPHKLEMALVTLIAKYPNLFPK